MWEEYKRGGKNRPFRCLGFFYKIVDLLIHVSAAAAAI